MRRALPPLHYCNIILPPLHYPNLHRRYLAFANTLQSLGIRLSHVSLGSWLHKKNSRGAWQLRWAMLDANAKVPPPLITTNFPSHTLFQLHYWRSRPSSSSVAAAGFVDVSRAVIDFDESSARAGVFVVKTSQKEVVYRHKNSN